MYGISLENVFNLRNILFIFHNFVTTVIVLENDWIDLYYEIQICWMRIDAT